jgi:leader peptidase (prepilin peptidase)/N-methyltransferase
MLLGKGQPGPQLLESEVAPSDAPPPPAEPAEVAQAASAGVPAGLGGDAGVDGGAGAEEDWVPPRNAVPFGPFLALATFEWLYAGAWLTDSLPFFRVFR